MFSDREYISRLVKIALPIIIQNFVASALNVVGVLFIGQLGETSIAAVGLANQIFFLLNLMLFGIVSGSAIFTAQCWGSGDLVAIRKVTGLCLGLSLVGSGLFTIIALGFPQTAMSLYTTDTQVITLGAGYLVIIGFSYIPTAISFTYAVQLRSTGNVRIPMFVSAISLGIGTFLNYAFIFGEFGLPKMGVSGAAVGTCIARLLECAAMVSITYLGKLPTAVRLVDMRGLSRAFIRRYMVTVLPVVANESIWALGISIYNMVYAHIGTEAIAAVNITSTIDQLAFVTFLGIGNASAIMIGNRIGAGEEEKAYTYARRGLVLVICLAVVTGLTLILLSGNLFGAYKISAEAAGHARGVLIVLSCALWLRSCNMLLIVGILRSGGDTRYVLLIDIGSVWLVGIPMALLGAFVFHLPVWGVVAMVMADEVAKFIGGMYRFFSRKWIKNIVHGLG
jgi:putative MATE family efflux protein